MFSTLLTNDRIKDEEILNDIKVLGDYIEEYFKIYTMAHSYRINKIIVDNISFFCNIEKKEVIELNSFILNNNNFEFKINENYIQQQPTFPFGIPYSNIDKLIDDLFLENNQNNQTLIKRIINIICHNYDNQYFISNKNPKYLLLGNGVDNLVKVSIHWNFNIKCHSVTINYEDHLSLLKEHFSTSIYDCLEALYIVKNKYLLYDNNLINPKKFIINNIETKLFSTSTSKECSVCFEQTNGITTCNHPICLPCRIKTLNSKCRSKCPICRNKCLENIIDNDDESESDDE